MESEAWRVSSQHLSYRPVALSLVKEDNNDTSWPTTGPCEGAVWMELQKFNSRALQSPETVCLWKGLDFPEIGGGGTLRCLAEPEPEGHADCLRRAGMSTS